MRAADVLEFLKEQLPEAEYDGGITLMAPSIEDGALLVDINGTYFAIMVEEF